ncbi:transporter [Bombiscardovia nodaiensis]|uniref:Transporter n=1 Tax=Bombiscardovia nodaiensis TaxID=2932181 RepID=A0ABN6SCG6_9BIFI|nr:transporter [Bombiscardovia nodaiensis]
MFREGYEKLNSLLARSFPTNLARIMLICCAALWGGSYVVAKVAIRSISPQWLMFLRMTGACMLLMLLFHKRIIRRFSRKIILPALAVGITYYGNMSLQTVALQWIDPGRSAFLTASYCVLTPFTIWAIFHRRPGMINVLAAIVCLTGVGFVALKPGSLSLSLSVGDWMTLGCALSYAINLAFMGHFTRTFSPLSMTFLQFAVAGVCFLVGALITEPLPSTSWFTTPAVLSFIYLIFFASFAAQIMQNVGLAHIQASTASIIMCTESIFSVAFSAMFMGEQITWTSLIGFTLIFFAILLSVIDFNRVLEKIKPKPRMIAAV